MEHEQGCWRRVLVLRIVLKHWRRPSDAGQAPGSCKRLGAAARRCAAPAAGTALSAAGPDARAGSLQHTHSRLSIRWQPRLPDALPSGVSGRQVQKRLLQNVSAPSMHCFERDRSSDALADEVQQDSHLKAANCCLNKRAPDVVAALWSCCAVCSRNRYAINGACRNESKLQCSTRSTCLCSKGAVYPVADRYCKGPNQLYFIPTTGAALP